MDLLDNPGIPAAQIQERIYYNDLNYEGNYIVICLHSDIRQKSFENYFIQLLRNNMITVGFCLPRQYCDFVTIFQNSGKMDYRDYLQDNLIPHFERFFRPEYHVILQQTLHHHRTVCRSLSTGRKSPSDEAAEKDNLYCFYEDHWLKNLIDQYTQTDQDIFLL